jgi:hypothetical protein
MTHINRFYKEKDGNWYIDLPEWSGHKADLQMVAGADILLNRLSKDTNEVTLRFSQDWFPGSRSLYLVKQRDEKGEGGADYIFEGTLNVWLCSVTLFVLGEYPPVIFFKSMHKPEKVDIDLSIIDK